MPNPASAGLPNPSNYTPDMSSGTVFDNVTGLSWQRDVDPGEYTWAQAKVFCGKLVLAGFSDWRLPTRIELISLVDFTRMGPAIDTDAFPNTPNDLFWTATPFVGDLNYAFSVSFGNGGTGYKENKMAFNRVRCVR